MRRTEVAIVGVIVLILLGAVVGGWLDTSGPVLLP